MTAPPMIVHCCHCTSCQRETGTAFALNALVESERVELLRGEPEAVALPSESGSGQIVKRCPECRVALWSHYGTMRDLLSFVRVGTLDRPAAFPPDIHIYTRSRLPWLQLPASARAVPEYYQLEQVWTPASIARRQALRASAGATQSPSR